MARIKINQTTVCGKDYFNTELLDVFPDEVCILGGGYTKEEALAEMKANREVWLKYKFDDAEVGQSCYGYRVEYKSEDKKRR